MLDQLNDPYILKKIIFGYNVFSKEEKRMKQHYLTVFVFGIIANQLFANKEYIAQFLPKNPVILEAGAHIGTDTIEMLQMWPECTIHAFEPLPKVYTKLIQNTQAFNNVYRYPFALSNNNGLARLYVSSGTSDASSSLLAPKEHLNVHRTVYFEETIEVPTITLDSWATEYKIDYIDFMWLDMQGHEFAMLKASPKILKTVKVIFLEVSYEELYVGTALFPEVKAWLEQQGFKYICELAENALFVRPSCCS